MNRTKLLSLFAVVLTSVLTMTGCGAGVEESMDEQPAISTEGESEPEVVSVSEQELTSVISCYTDANRYCRSVGYSYSVYLAKCYWRGNYLVKTVTCR
jgi:hypothetical protein